jgi:pimeloyl-ACP methyl ester carboxylesterase
MVETLWRRWSPAWQFERSDLEPVKNAFAAPGCLHAALGYYRAATVRAPRLLRAPIRLATLSIVGADDPGVKSEVFESVRHHYRQQYEVATVPGGHFCHRESPKAVLDALLSFLA